MLKRFTVSLLRSRSRWRVASGATQSLVVAQTASCPSPPTARPVGLRPAARRHRSRPPTPAPTSSSSRAAPGWRRTRSPPIDRAGDASTSCRSATTTRCGRSSTRPRPARDPGGEEDRRLLRVVHGRNRDQRARAPRRSIRCSKKIAGARPASAGSPPLVAELHTIGVNAFFTVRRRSGLQGRVARDGDRRPGRARPARTATTTSATMPKSVDLRKQYVEHIGKMAALLGDAPDRGRRRRRSRPWRSRPRSRRRRSTSCRAATRTRSTTSCRAAELQALTPQFQWPQHSPASARRRSTRSTSPSPAFFKALGQTRWRRRRSTRSRRTCAGTSSTPRRRCWPPRSSTRTSASTARC